MTRRPAVVVLLLALLAGLLAGLPAVTVAGSAAVAAGPVAAKRSTTTQVQHVTVRWKGDWRKPDYVETAVVPGIGELDLICRPNDTRIRLFTERRDRETQMWLQKYEEKNGRDVVAVKNARIYRYAHADDDGDGGTGFAAHEGLNQQPGIENRSQGGYMYGVISQRSSRSADGGQVRSPLPVTTFELTWNWNGFDHPQEYRSCEIDATVTTQFPATSRLDLTWRGSGEVRSGLETASATLPQVGQLRVSCARERTERPQVWVEPAAAAADLYVEDVQGEGPVAQRRDTTSFQTAEGGVLGPYPLPSNGSLRMRVTSGEETRWVLLSSNFVRNNPAGQRNFCDVAAGFYRR